MCSYQDSADLRKIKRWKCTALADVPEWLAAARALWSYHDRWPKPKRGDVYIWVSTGGWSYNEDVIAAMRSNSMWGLVCEATRKGGHFVLRVDFAAKPDSKRARAQLRAIFAAWVF